MALKRPVEHQSQPLKQQEGRSQQQLDAVLIVYYQMEQQLLEDKANEMKNWLKSECCIIDQQKPLLNLDN
jgi:hypothetical protein